MENPRRINEKIDEKSMQIRWKIVQNRAWRCVGASWGLLGCLIGILEGASWERLESVLERLGGVLVASRSAKGTPQAPQDGPKIGQKSNQNRIDFLIDFQMRF